ncbi:radical SAM protein [bacterium]|nr:radical SAM protein [candidate division CSSED10-310 bacterium]
MSFKALRKRNFRQLLNIFRTRYGRFTEANCRHDPSDIMVFITTRCNLTCYTCPFTRPSPYSPPAGIPDITLEFFTSVLDRYRRASVVGLVGGEPLLHPDLPAMIRIAAGRKMSVNVSTNGTLLDETRSRELLDTPLGFLNISLDAPDEAEYRRIRGGSPELYRNILANAERFSEMKNRSGSGISLWLSFVTGRSNVDRIPDFVNLARNIGADRVFCQNTLTYKTSDLTTGQDSLHDTPEIRNLLAGLDIPKDIPVVLPPLVPVDADCKCVHCKHPFTMLSLDGAGNLSPCCVIPPHPRYGNISGDLNTWRSGKELSDIRRSMICESDAFDEICLDCWERFSMGRPHENH